jgi:hypothetical protein
MTNTLTKARYQGRTYKATLTTGHEVIITVEAGHLPEQGGGEIARLNRIAVERFGFAVAAAEIVEPTAANEDRGSGRCWAVELKRPMTCVEYGWDGQPLCYGDYETDYERVTLNCPGMILTYMGQLAPGWDVTDFCESGAQAEDLDPCPF